ncbi:RAB11-binding protein RELCH homolog [Styela clava]
MMSDYTNPFTEEFIEDASHIEQEDINLEESSNHFESPERSSKVNVDSIAEYLLRKQYVLTALELHMELMESGKELSRLRNYFSNPGNFEQHVNNSRDYSSNSLYRTGSISTFDSLDLTHYSDDGAQQDDRVAVLEFELRKAKETINSLRMSLTGALDEESFLNSDGKHQNGIDSDSKHPDCKQEDESVDCNPLFKRALNYLVNEYLLQNDYKLTSITLADENEDQDFEDWDDVGLNMAKPPNLSKLFQEYSSHRMPRNNHRDMAVGTEGDIFSNENCLKSLQSKCEQLEKENFELTAIITQLRKDASVYQDSVDSSTPKKVCDVSGYIEENMKASSPPLSRKPSKDTSLSIISKTESTNTLNMQLDEEFDNEQIGIFKNQNSENRIDHIPPPERMPVQLWEKLFCFWKDDIANDYWLFNEVSQIAASTDELVSTLSSCLPKIVPTVLLQKRDQLIPLLLSTASMHPNANERNSLLHHLFNLIKKPEKSQRQMILCGCVAYAELVGPMRTEEDLLPQFWEQIGHKYTERRHLVAEACGTISPYLTKEMRSSLLLSILLQMEQEESEVEIRQAIVHSLSVLTALLNDEDKYNQVFKLLCSLLKDSNTSVQLTTRTYFLPSFACWARQNKKLCTHLIDHMLSNVESTVSGHQDDKRVDFDSSAFTFHMENLYTLLPHLFADILLSMPEQYRNQTKTTIENGIAENGEKELKVLLSHSDENKSLVNDFSTCVSSADLNNWDSLSWCLYQFLPRLVEIVRRVGPESQDSVSTLSTFVLGIVNLFGTEFTNSKLKDKFSDLFIVKADDISREILSGNTALTSAAVPVYASSILLPCDESSKFEKLSTFLNDTLTTLATCHAPLTSIEIAFVEIRKKDTKFHDVLLDVLWNGITHPSNYIRAASGGLLATMATENVSTKLLMTRVLPALLTLSKDNSENVRIATVPAFGALLECSHIENEIIDRVISQFTSFIAPSHQEGSESPTSNHAMNVQMVKTMAAVTPKADPRFRDEFVLPHLAAMAAKNNQESNATKRSDISLALMEAFTNISCCFISDGLLQSAFLPGLRCLSHDIDKLHPEHSSHVNKLIINMEVKLEHRTPITPSPSSDSLTSHTSVTSNSDTNNKSKFKLFYSLSSNK